MGRLELGDRRVVTITPSCADLGAFLAKLARASSAGTAADGGPSRSLGGRSLGGCLSRRSLLSRSGLVGRSGVVSRSSRLSLDGCRRLGRFTAGRAHRMSLGGWGAVCARGGGARLAALALIALLLCDSTVLEVTVHMGVTQRNGVGGRGPE